MNGKFGLLPAERCVEDRMPRRECCVKTGYPGVCMEKVPRCVSELSRFQPWHELSWIFTRVTRKQMIWFLMTFWANCVEKKTLNDDFLSAFGIFRIVELNFSLFFFLFCPAFSFCSIVTIYSEETGHEQYFTVHTCSAFNLISLPSTIICTYFCNSEQDFFFFFKITYMASHEILNLESITISLYLDNVRFFF